MPILRILIGAAAAASCALAAVSSLAQGYPNKPIRVVTSGVGGGLDIAARVIGPAFSENLGQPIVVDNRASGVIPGEIVSKAEPDGYTLLFFGSTFWVGPLFQRTPYDPVKNFAPISLTNQAPAVLAIHPSVPARSVKELIALARSRPGKLNFGTSGTGAPNHLAGELFKSMAGINIVRVAFRGSGTALTSLISGEVQIMFVPAATVAPHLKTGRLRALAVTSLEPTSLAPNLPTLATEGLPGYEIQSIHALFAPAGTPAAVISRLNRAVVAALRERPVRDRLYRSGFEIVGSTPAQLATRMREEMARFGKLIDSAGLRIN